MRAFYCDHFVLPTPEGHRFPIVPCRKERSDLDVPLPDGTGDEEYLAHLSTALDLVFATTPDLVFLSSRALIPARETGWGR